MKNMNRFLIKKMPKLNIGHGKRGDAMGYAEFKNKYNGKYIDVDNQYGAQCLMGFGTEILY